MTEPQTATHHQRLHDLKGVHASFHSTLKLLKGGYRFDDEDAASALARLEKAVSELAAELRRLEKDWRADGKL